ncbi:MAG TPA: hypothetical protein VJK51_04325 [Candidatus Nanoarchaeia archaeon]|nr:hypothetical protein [Candidatus Nanoarchaeia archaeon]
MVVKSVSRQEIDQKLPLMGDYVKIDYLQQCLKVAADFDTKKFVLVKLAGLYEGRGMFMDAGKLMSNAAEINTTFEGKMQDFMRSFELYLKGGVFDEAEVSYAKGLACGSGMQKDRMKERRKQSYVGLAEEYMNKDKRTYAMKTYEKILAFELSPDEKRSAQQTLLGLYDKLGKIREFYALKKAIG